MGMMQEFKDFAVTGNVVDMAVGIIIGGAFGTIATTLVSEVIMPPIGILLGGIDLSNLFLTIQDGATAGPYTTLEIAKEAGAVTMNIGKFLNSLISFVIVAFVVFMLIRQVNRLKRAEPVDEMQEEPSEEILLLREINKSLKVRKSNKAKQQPK